MTKKVFGKSVIDIFRIISLMAILLLVVPGCSDDDDDDDLTGNWIELSDFEGVPRCEAVCFTIGDKAYVGTGYDGEDRLSDFWEYDPASNQWNRKADFPGVARSGAVGFGTDSKGYMGTGYDGVNKLKDFWEFDPSKGDSGTWTQIADFDGSARYDAIAFSVNNKGYVGTGYDDNDLKDLWEYDPLLNKWTAKKSLEGSKRRGAIVFVIDGKAYVGTGIDNGVYESDFWVYDPSVDDWTDRRAITDESDDDYDDDYSGITGINKSAFAVGGRAYVVGGNNGSVGTDVWEYDPVADLWARKTYLETSARIEAIGFAIGDLGYIATGKNSSYYFDDLWGFRPGEEQIDYDKVMIVSASEYAKKTNTRL
jgi:N-acetylneuraminic acid mutarotase